MSSKGRLVVEVPVLGQLNISSKSGDLKADKYS